MTESAVITKSRLFMMAAVSIGFAADQEDEARIDERLAQVDDAAGSGRYGYEALAKALETMVPEAVVEELYIRCLSRPPTDVESAEINALLDAEEDKKAALEDVFWALLNSKEFIFNH